MQRRTVWIMAAIAIVIAFLALLISSIRLAPPGQAYVARIGDDLRIVSQRAALKLPGEIFCYVPVKDGHAIYEGKFEGEDQGGATIGVAVRFEYTVPARIPSDWMDGNWCDALSIRVGREATAFLGDADFEPHRRDPRRTGELVAELLKKRFAELHPRNLTVRLRVPESARASLSVPGIASLATKEKPVIFIGLDGADWQLLDAYMRDGAMPNLQSLVREGIAGELLTEHPPLSPLLWTTMMTGTSPVEHEILDFTRFHPVTGTKEPITSDERKVPAVWNMATQAGKSVAVLGLWATYLPEPVNGLIVSDRFFLSKDTVYGPSRELWARDIALDAERLAHVEKFIPSLSAEEVRDARMAQDPYAHPVSALHRIVTETNAYDRIAREYFEEKQPDLTILYLQGTDSIGHIFAPYTPPRQANISEADFARYSNIPSLYFREIDRILGEHKALAKKHGARLMIASDHGFHWFDDRPTELSSFAAGTAAKWHRNAGVYLLWGDGIAARGRTGPQQRIAQVAATLLALTGMPGAADTEMSPIVVPASKSVVDYRANFVRVKPGTSQPSNESLAQLRALGYIGAGEATSAPRDFKTTHTSGWYNNRGLILKDAASFEQAIAVDPNHPSAYSNLSDLLFERDRDRSDSLLVRAFALGLPEGRKHVIGRAIGYQRNGDAARSLRLLEQAVAAKPDDPEVRVFRGRYRLEANDCAGALEDFRAVQTTLAKEFASVAERCVASRK